MWALCGAAPLSAYDAQRVLTRDGVRDRLELLALLMEEVELDLLRLLESD